ncbi:MAG: peptidase T [Bacteroidota bacterium]|nr:peptidase T [Bacteroidota bacterium]
MEKLIDRFFSYVRQNTQSDSKTGLVPSTPGQLRFAKELAAELTSIGLTEVDVDENGYVMATLPSNINHDVPVVGFIAHMDTSPDFSARHINPQVVANYNGDDIVLNQEEQIVLSTTLFPELKDCIGQTLITTDGKTLLGADDKAGIAEIVTAAEYLVAHPEIPHGKVRICFTPDEEIGHGADYFDVKRFGADFAYTMDGGEIGELQYENFNAAFARVLIHGRNVHPGYARGKMRNSMRIANQFISMLPRHEVPEHTQEYEGFYHLTSIQGNVELTEMDYIIRDFKKDRFEDRKSEMHHLVKKINSEFGEGTAEVEINDQYYNMREKIEPVMYVIDLARKAMEEVDVKPKVIPIRGGTDGARISFMGLPCPNIFAGGHNFHGKYEFIPVESMQKAVDVILKIIDLTGEIR